MGPFRNAFRAHLEKDTAPELQARYDSVGESGVPEVLLHIDYLVYFTRNP